VIKLTFTFDEETVRRLRETAARLDKPQSHVVREAIREYAGRAGKMSEEETGRMLEIFDRVVPAIPPKPQEEVDAELVEIRAARRRWGRRSPGRRR
jgi:hypothetical protein